MRSQGFYCQKTVNVEELLKFKDHNFQKEVMAYALDKLYRFVISGFREKMKYVLCE